MRFKLAVFDLAGTTVKDNKDVHRVLQSAMSKHGVAISIDDANEVMGIPKPIAIRALLEKRYTGSQVISEEWIHAIHEDFVREMINFYRHDESVGEKDGVSETFASLKQKGIIVAVDTGFDRQIIDPLLKRLGWLDRKLIDASITSDEVKRGRPHPDMIFALMEKTGVTDSNAVVKVGDTASDVQEGTAANCGLVVGVTTGAFSEEALLRERPHQVIKSIPEILNFL